MSNLDNCNEGKNFVEFRRKVQAAEVLSAAIEHLLKSLKFSGKLSVMVQNGRVLKSGYEEGYFRQPHSRSAGGEQIYCVACGRKMKPNFPRLRTSQKGQCRTNRNGGNRCHAYFWRG